MDQYGRSPWVCSQMAISDGLLCENDGFRDGKDLCYDLMGYGTVLSDTWLPLFRRGILLSSSG